MVTSGFGPHHGLMWLDATPTKCIGIIPTPWGLMDVLGLVKILQAQE